MDLNDFAVYAFWYCGKRKNVNYLMVFPTKNAINEIKDFLKYYYKAHTYSNKMFTRNSLPNVLFFDNGSKILLSQDLKEYDNLWYEEEICECTISEEMYPILRLKFDYMYIHPWCDTTFKNCNSMLKKKGKLL